MAALGLYNNVPAEIALLVWKQAISTHGVHHFRLSLANPYENDQLLMVAPWTTAEKDASTWRHRWDISLVDENSWDEYGKWATKTKEEGVLWIGPVHQKNYVHPRHRSMAKVHGTEDLVVITLTDTKTNLDVLDEDRNKTQFRGLQRIALNWKQMQTGRNWLLTPFKCICPSGVHEDMAHCPVQIVKLLRLFPDLKHFYFIFRIAANDIVLPETVKRGRSTGTATTSSAQAKRATVKKGRVAKAKPKIMMNAAQIIDGTLNAIRRIAEKQNLEIWSDSERTYYEIGGDQLQRLKENREMAKVITNLKREWRGVNNPQMSRHEKKRLASTQFHFLVCRDRINRK